MPIPEERLHRPDKLNRWFAVSSILMTISILWLIKVDYERQWHAYQDNYMVSRAAFAHLDYLDTQRQERVQEVQEAAQRVEDTKKLDASINATTRAKLTSELAEADLNWRIKEAPHGRLVQVLQVLRDTYERSLGAHGPDHPETKKAEREVRQTFEEAEQLRKEKEQWEDRKRELAEQLKTLDHPIREAEKRKKELEQFAEEALEKDRQFRGLLKSKTLLANVPIVKWAINAPLLDFTAPKNTPSRRQVNQLVLPDVRQRLNYLESYTTDRCTTCHVSIHEPEFSRENLARKLEQSLPGINEALQRDKKQPFDIPAPPVLAGEDASKLPVGRVTEHWDLLTRQQQDDYFNTLLSLTNSYLKQSGRKTLELKEPLFAHPDLDLFVSVDSPHPMNTMGCTVCHEGNSQETDFILAAHSPPTHEVEKRWKEEFYIHILGVPNMTFETMAHFWDRPMRWPQHTEAGCAKCHSNIADIDRFRGERTGTKINHGRYLFGNLGCINCHEVKTLGTSRRVGPELTYMSSKLTPEFAQQWIYFPQKFRPSSRMPHFFEQENNRAEGKNELDPKPVLRAETEVAAITKYLFAVSQPWKPIEKPADVTGDVDRGRALFKEIGCLACHSNLAEFGASWISKDIAAREKIDEKKAQSRYEGMTYEDRSLYARDHFTSEVDTWLNPKKVKFDPGSPEPPPTFTRLAPELSGIGSKVKFEWLYSWLMEPTHYFKETKMPTLRLSPTEAADIAAYLLTLKHDQFVPQEFALNADRKQMVDDLILGILTTQRSERQSRAILRDEGRELEKMVVALLDKSLKGGRAYDLVSPMSVDDKKLMFLGNKMISHYGCYACHTIAGFEEATAPGTELTSWAEKPVGQLDFAFYDHAFHDMRHDKEHLFGHVYPTDAAELNKWSPGENAKEQITHTHAAFAKHKMLNPRIWDREKIKAPYDKLKMPNFYLSEKEADALTTFLLSRIPARVSDVLKVDYDDGVDGPLARGRNLVRELNCIGCHEIEDNVPTIQQYFRRPIGNKLTFDHLNAPPSLRGEGAKIQHAWFHDFLHKVETLRPWLQIRMPSFPISPEESTTLVEFFAALSRDESNMLAKALTPVQEYRKVKNLAAEKISGGKDKAKDAPEPGSDWYNREFLELHADTLRRFGLERRLVRPIEVDELRSPPEDVQKGHRNLVERTEFIRNLYDVPYPFVDPPKALSPDKRFELGDQLLNEMGCLKCHVMGNMLPAPAKNTDEFVQRYRLDSVRGEGDKAIAVINGQTYPVGAEIDGHKLISALNKVYEDTGDVETKAIFEGPKADGSGTEKIQLQAASAPNLSLTHRRLRRDWVLDWMLQPGWIQPGTKMPMNFPEGKSPFENEPKYAGEKTMELLVDFLYDAGFKGARSPLPKLIPAEAKEFEDEEFIEE